MVYRSTSSNRSGKPVSRRQFGMTTGVAVLGTGLVGMALLDRPRTTLTTVSEAVSMGNPSNPTPAFFVRPVSGKHPGVVFWRADEVMTEAERDKARQLSEKGYAVLVIDRHSGDARSAPSDTYFATAWLEQHQQVNRKIGIGTPEWALRRLEPVIRV